VRRRRLDYIPGAKESLSSVFHDRGCLKDSSMLAHLSEGRQARVMLAAAWTIVEMAQQNLRERFYPLDLPMPDERRGRPRGWWDARDLPRIDAHAWRAEVLSRPRGRLLPYEVPIRIVGTEDGEDGKDHETVTIQTATLVVRDRPVGGPRVLFQCPRCRRLCRYLYAGLYGLTCRDGLGLVYRPKPGAWKRWNRKPAPTARERNIRFLERLAQSDPHLAAEYAQALGIPWPPAPPAPVVIRVCAMDPSGRELRTGSFERPYADRPAPHPALADL
jgi:hypothetical protein